MTEEEGKKKGGTALKDMDPDQREQSVMMRADKMFRTLPPSARRRVVEYLGNKYNQMELEEHQTRMMQAAYHKNPHQYPGEEPPWGT